MDDLATADTDKAEWLNAYLISVFINKVSQVVVIGRRVQE